MSYVLCDIGGTKTRVAVSEDLKTFSDPIRFSTPATASEGVKKIVEAVHTLTDKKIRAMAGGIRGVLNHDHTELIFDPGNELEGWIEKPFIHALQNELETQVRFENDAALVGLGEATFGAGKGEDIVVYHTVSTGVGGARIVYGQISPVEYGFEPGHQILDIDKTILGTEVAPTLENLISGSAVEERMGVKPYDIPQNDVIWDQLAMYLGQGLRNTILYWSPDVIVLGGSMIVGDPRIKLEDIIQYTEAALDEVVPTPRIVDAALADDGGLYGAMALLAQDAQ